MGKMAPIRTKQKASPGNEHGASERQRKDQAGKGQNALPGAQKIKASIRQTRRLLSKHNLAADVRVETERRLKSLESDLQKVELAKQERRFAVKYHKVKFFERQKVVRKINQMKKLLESSKSDEKIESALYELRVDLNYILHYPKTKRYISLFPPEVRNGETRLAVEGSETSKERDEVRSWIREKMVAGELPAIPEEKKTKIVSVAMPHPHKSGKAGNISEARTTMPTGDIEHDEFFGEDADDEESDESNE